MRVRLLAPLLIVAQLSGPARADRAPPGDGAPLPPAGAATPPSPAAPSAPNAADLEAAKIHFQQGVALFNDGNFNAALAEFQEAYRLRQSPGVLYNVGLTQKALFRYAEAIASLEKFLAEETKLTPERKAEVHELVTEMRALLADITVVVEPAGASILVDGRSMGTSPLAQPLALSAGSHVIEVAADGYRPARRDLLVTAGVPLSLNLRLEAIPRTGKVRIFVAQPNAQVRIDERPYGAAPVSVELPGGGHQLVIEAPGYQLFRSELVVAAGQARDVNLALELPPRKARFYERWYFWTPIVLGVVAGAAVGVGVGLSHPEAPLVGTLSPGVGQVN